MQLLDQRRLARGWHIPPVTSLDPMDEQTTARIKQLADIISSTANPVERLRAAKQLREVVEDLERRCARAAFEGGTSWASIGEIYGASKQAMAQRFRHAGR